MKHSQIIKKVNEYYSRKVLDCGPVPQGVDWNSAESQRMRFAQLAKILPEDSGHFSVLDYGCGYGALYEYLQSEFNLFDYSGYDISEAMIAEAGKKYREKNIKWLTDAR